MSAYALPGFFPPVSFDGTKATASCFDSFHFDISSSFQLEEKVPDDSDSSVTFTTSQLAEVHVKEAKIDALELVKSLTSSKTKQSKLSRGRIRRATTLNNRNVNKLNNSCNDDNTCPSLESAMLFELYISFDDRTYEPVRSLARIRQLHRELVEESNHYSEMGLDDSDNSSIRIRRQIPDLPELVESSSTSSFGLLNVALNEYRPTLESWLTKVIDIVGIPNESPSLSYFLCEPLLQCRPVVPKRQGLTRGESAPSRLERILEEVKSEEDVEDLEL